MITDALLQLSIAQAITVDAVSTNTIDLSQNRDIGEGQNLYMTFTVGTAFAGGTSIDFQIITSDNADLSSPTVIGSTGAVLTANLAAEDQHVLRIPPQIGSLGKRYIGVNYDVSGTFTAGTVTADVTLDISDDQKFYPSGYTV